MDLLEAHQFTDRELDGAVQKALNWMRESTIKRGVNALGKAWEIERKNAMACTGPIGLEYDDEWGEYTVTLYAAHDLQNSERTH